jgi:hypothetical protein
MEPAVEDFIIEVACTLASELRRQIHPKGCLNGMRNLGGPSEKLIYMYLWLTQPQTSPHQREPSLSGRGGGQF